MIIFLSLSIVINIYLLFVLFNNKKPKPTETIVKQEKKMDVGKFYNEQTVNFLKVYGNVIQAFRTRNVSTLLNYQIKAMGLEPVMSVLDAGCGVCGPAIYFAENAGVNIDAITISSVQVEMSKENINQSSVRNKINVREGDYHSLEKYYPANNLTIKLSGLHLTA